MGILPGEHHSSKTEKTHKQAKTGYLGNLCCRIYKGKNGRNKTFKYLQT